MNFKLNVSQEFDYFQEKFFISDATIRNWKKLNTKSSERLTSRANKKNSNKKFLPTEYFSDRNNIEFVKNLIDYVELENFDIESVIFSLALNLLNRNNLQNKSLYINYHHSYGNYIVLHLGILLAPVILYNLFSLY